MSSASTADQGLAAAVAAPAGQVPAGLCVPSGSVVRSLFRQQQDAASRVGAASTQVGDAQARLDAARRAGVP
ncbi:hypothetical protein [Pseudoclavibacter soli]|uniref:hypothetical protein n=1 Tax=Pseudoclavibacter soli TaxID=452623 RepID=UPI0004050116|nr:hypothetical protein [Pseudoclavibacter soli]